MEPNRPSSSARRRFRISLTVWLGVVLLLASVAIASLSLRSHAGNRSAPEPAATAADGQRWMVLGYADVEGGVTPLYPQRPGQVKSIEARENETVQAGARADPPRRCVGVDAASAGRERPGDGQG